MNTIDDPIPSFPTPYAEPPNAPAINPSHNHSHLVYAPPYEYAF